MTPELKAKLEALRAKAAEDLTETEKAELALLVTIEKQAGQITEKDSLIGTKGTEIETLKASIATKTGKEKTALEDQLASKEEALSTMTLGLDALKEAHKINAAAISPEKPGHGDTVDPKEVEALEAKAYANPKVREEVEKRIEELEDEDWERFQNSLEFKKLFLQTALGSVGDETGRSPWGRGVKKDEGVPEESDKDRVARLFKQEGSNHRRLPPSTSGRGGRGGRGLPGMPKAKERPVDTRTQ